MGCEETPEEPASPALLQRTRVRPLQKRDRRSGKQRHAPAAVLDVRFTRFYVLRLATGLYVVGLVAIVLCTLGVMYVLGRDLAAGGDAADAGFFVHADPVSERGSQLAALALAPFLGFLAALALRLLIEMLVVPFRIAESLDVLVKDKKSPPPAS